MFLIEQKKTWLLDAAPAGSSRWLSLFHQESSPDGTGFVEAAIARLEIDTWITNVIGEFTVERSNVLLVEFPPLANYLLDVVGWGLFDHVTDAAPANLRATDRFRDSVLYSFKPGEVPRFQPGDIRLIISPAPIDTPPPDPDMETCQEFDTTDATPQSFDLGTVLDTAAHHVECTVTADGFDGHGGKHYFRRFFISFERLDSDTGMGVWIIRQTTIEGGQTRKRLTTATAMLVDDGTDKIRVDYTGEAATSLHWKICWKGI